MTYTFFTPGPSQLYPTMKNHIKRFFNLDMGSISHRSKQFEEIFSHATNGLRKLLKVPHDYAIVFVSSGTEAMERVIENTVEKRSFHFVNGSFSKRWYEIAVELGIDAGKDDAKFGAGFNNVPKIIPETELICITQNETSSGVWIKPEFIYKIQEQNPSALIAVDIVTSAPIVDLDYTKLDCVFFSVQKNFGLPAGLGVLILSPRAVEKAKALQKMKTIGTYHNFVSLVEWAIKNQAPETPNVFAIYLLGKVVEDFLDIGIDSIRKDIFAKADMIYRFLEKKKMYKPFVEKEFRSLTVIVANVAGAKTIQQKLEEEEIVIGGGYGPLKERQIRVANFPTVSKKDIERLLNFL